VQLVQQGHFVLAVGRSEQLAVPPAGPARDDPAALLAALAVELLAGESFSAACAELASALILDGATVDYSDALAGQIHPAIVAEGWRSAGRHPSRRDVAWAVAHFLRPAESVGLLARAQARRATPVATWSSPPRDA